MRSEFGHRVWSAIPEHLYAVRAEVRRWLRPLELTAAAQEDLLLAVNEAVTNSIEHAYSASSENAVVALTFWTDEHAVWFEVTDRGVWRAPAPSRNRGRGIALMQRLVDSVLIRHGARGTRVLLGFSLPGEARDLSGIPRRPASLQVAGYQPT